MVNYANGKIYKIVDNTNGNIYIGSTTLPLTHRLSQHRTEFNKNNERSTKSFDIIKNGDYNIILIEEVKCDNKEQLLRKERFYIESMICLNKYVPLRTDKEYRQENNEKIKEGKRVYRRNNLETIKERDKKYYENNKDTFSEKSKIYYENNKEAIISRTRNYYEENGDKIREKFKLYRAANRDSINTRQREKRLMKKTNLL